MKKEAGIVGKAAMSYTNFANRLTGKIGTKASRVAGKLGKPELGKKMLRNKRMVGNAALVGTSLGVSAIQGRKKTPRR